MRSHILPCMLLLAASCIAMPALSQGTGASDRPNPAPSEGVLPRNQDSPPTTAPLPGDRGAAPGSQKSQAPFEGSGDNFGPPDGIPGGPAKTPGDVGGSSGGSGGSFTGGNQPDNGRVPSR